MKTHYAVRFATKNVPNRKSPALSEDDAIEKLRDKFAVIEIISCKIHYFAEVSDAKYIADARSEELLNYV